MMNNKVPRAGVGGLSGAGRSAIATDLLPFYEGKRGYLSACGEDLPPELPCRPADLIDVRDPKATQAIFDVMRSDTERTVEAEGKNGKPASDQ